MSLLSVQNDTLRFHGRRRLFRRRGVSLGCRRDTGFYKFLLNERDAEIRKHRKKIAEFTRRDAKNAALILQVQAESFFHHLELQSLRNAVRELAQTKAADEETFRAFATEVEGLERQVRQIQAPEELDYEISETDWLAIIGS